MQEVSLLTVTMPGIVSFPCRALSSATDEEKHGLIDGRLFLARPTIAYAAPLHHSQTNTPSLSHLKEN